MLRENYVENSHKKKKKKNKKLKKLKIHQNNEARKIQVFSIASIKKTIEVAGQEQDGTKIVQEQADLRQI
jgi:hypothetical protein